MDGGEAMVCAAALEQHADEMVCAGDRIGALAAAMTWESSASTRARREIDGVVAALRQSAAGLREAATAVRHHGAEVQAAWAQLETATREVDRLARSGLRAMQHAVAADGTVLGRAPVEAAR